MRGKGVTDTDEHGAAQLGRNSSGDGAAARHETPTERLDRIWTDLLQELRVIQTGVQFLTGFLLTLPFQQKFGSLSMLERNVYLATVSASIAATALLQAPVTVHRALFRLHARRATVLLAHRLSLLGMSFLAAAITGVAFLVFAFVAGTSAGVAAGVATALLLLGLWLALPLSIRESRPRR